jgi:hypothetical protein
MRLRPGLHAAGLMWAQQFKGEAVDLSGVADADVPPGTPRPNSRRVATQPR